LQHKNKNQELESSVWFALHRTRQSILKGAAAFGLSVTNGETLGSELASVDAVVVMVPVAIDDLGLDVS
jgi:hypothetical protein